MNKPTDEPASTGFAPSVSPSDDSAVLRAVQEYLAALEAGQPPHRDEFLARHPQIAEALADCLDGLEMMHTVAPQLRQSGDDAGPARESDRIATWPCPLGDFRIVRELGRGGMGVVYEAEQMSLGRRVALKVLPFTAAMDSRQLQRFKNEAQAAAQLHHTNIVPVHAVGCERGVHYYAMQLIEGQTLAGIIRELQYAAGTATMEAADRRRGDAAACELASGVASGRFAPAEAARAAQRNPGELTGPYTPQPEPAVAGCQLAATPAADTPGPLAAAISTERPTRRRAYFRTVAQLGVQAALALEHAHQLGVVHRDIKPSNLLLEGVPAGPTALGAGPALGAGLPTPPHTLRLWITDFGLAQVHSQASLTLTGDLVGTLRYMSPEQALAKRVPIDHRTDIYSLGATLYELLTLRPVFDGRDRQELLRQIAFEDPRVPRRINKAIPAELETITLKAMEKNPAERYVTAQELADDLQRFLNDEPIRAKRPTLVQWAGKWARRHQTLTRAAVVIVILTLVATTVLVWREKHWTDKAFAELSEEQKETQAARLAEAKRRRQARRALDKMSSHFIEDLLARQKHLLPEHKKFLEEALADYEEFVRDVGDDQETREGVADAYLRVGNIHGLLGQSAEAEKAFLRGHELYGLLAVDFPDAAQYRGGSAVCLNNLGAIVRERHKLDEAENAFRRAIPILKEVTAKLPAVRRWRQELAGCLNNLGILLMDLGRPVEAEVLFRQAQKTWAKLAADFPRIPFYRMYLARALRNLSNVVLVQGREADAETSCRKARDIARKLATEFLAVPEYSHESAETEWSLGNLLVHTDRKADEAEASFRKAQTTAERLVGLYPSVPDYRELLADSLEGLGRVQTRLGKAAEAHTAFRLALAIQEKLASEFPLVPKYRHELAKTHHDLGFLLAALGRQADAEPICRKAVDLLEKLAKDSPRVAKYRYDLASSLSQLGKVLRDLGKRPAAEAALRKALTTFEELVTDFRTVALYRAGLADRHNNIGAELSDRGRWADAEAAFRKAAYIYEELAVDSPDSTIYRRTWALTLNNLGQALNQQGKHPEAEKLSRQALAIQAKLAEAYPAVAEYRHDLARTYGNLGTVLDRQNRLDEAEITYRQSQSTFEKLVKEFPKLPQYRQEWAMCLNNLSLLLGKRGRLDDAEVPLRQSLTIRKKLVAEFRAIPIFAVDLGTTYLSLGMLASSQNKPEAALDWYGKAIDTMRAVLTQDHRLIRARERLCAALSGRAQILDKLARHAEAVKDWDECIALAEESYRLTLQTNRAMSLVRAGDHSRAVAAAEELAQAKAIQGSALYDLACVCAQAAVAVKADAKLKDRYGDRAIDLLRQAFSRGFKDVAHMKKDPDLDSLRSRVGYKTLLDELEAKAKP
jgi:serine/threonine protein kinase/Tfp pilus assembly protein PilF